MPEQKVAILPWQGSIPYKTYSNERYNTTFTRLSRSGKDAARRAHQEDRGLHWSDKLRAVQYFARKNISSVSLFVRPIGDVKNYFTMTKSRAPLRATERNTVDIS